MELEQIIDNCAATTLSKGFNVKNYPAQLLLMATEVGEALENVWPKDDELVGLCAQLVLFSQKVERLRKQREWSDEWEWAKRDENLLEELADIQIRLASFIGGNDMTDDFMKALVEKMKVNRDRPHLHGKKN